MEIVITIAEKVVEHTVAPIVQWLGYSFRYSNMENVKKQKEKLQGARERVQHSVHAAINNAEKFETDVNRWLENVDFIMGKVKEVIEVEEKVKMRCSNGACLNLKQRHQQSVAKSTLLREVAKKVKEERLFDEVAIAIVKQNPDQRRIQGEIADKLDLDLKLAKETLSGRADLLRERLTKDKNKKILVILDDIWEKLDLDEIGISGQGCKLVVSSSFLAFFRCLNHLQYCFATAVRIPMCSMPSKVEYITKRLTVFIRIFAPSLRSEHLHHHWKDLTPLDLATQKSSFIKGQKLWFYVTGEMKKPVKGSSEDEDVFGIRLIEWDTLPRICSPNDIPLHMALGNICFSIEHSYGTNLISLIHHGILLNDAMKYATRHDQMHLYQFLMALHDDYEPVRGQLLHQIPTPSLNATLNELHGHTIETCYRRNRSTTAITHSDTYQTSTSIAPEHFGSTITFTTDQLENIITQALVRAGNASSSSALYVLPVQDPRTGQELGTWPVELGVCLRFPVFIFPLLVSLLLPHFHLPYDFGILGSGMHHLPGKLQQILDTVRALLLSSKVPAPFWGEAVLTAAHAINRIPSPTISNQTPYKAPFWISTSLSTSPDPLALLVSSFFNLMNRTNSSLVLAFVASLTCSTPSPEMSTSIPQTESSDHSSGSFSDESPHSSSEVPGSLHLPRILPPTTTLRRSFSVGVQNQNFGLTDPLSDTKLVLLPKDFTQEYGIDYKETFTPVAFLLICPHLIGCCSFSLVEAISDGCQKCLSQWGLKHLKLGLLSSALQFLDWVFSISSYDSALFLRRTTAEGTILLLLYVDDMIITGDDLNGIQEIKDFLSQNFEMKDLGHLSYFLGLEITSSDDGFYLTQANLVYLTVTQPDISYAAHQVTQFISAPQSTHYAAALRILRYLKGTLFHGLHFSAQSPLILRVYSDADWVGDPTDRRSTTGFRCVHFFCYSLSIVTIGGAIQIARNDVFHERTKHIEIDCHLVLASPSPRVPSS
uniref:NB-ARC domain-containing protein n=1 Tax=Fagus sylvatica TaxID=28930 RepID=A0A2N9GYQ2_FAGSY